MSDGQPQLPTGWQLPAGHQHDIRTVGRVMVLNSSCIFALNDL